MPAHGVYKGNVSTWCL